MRIMNRLFSKFAAVVLLYCVLMPLQGNCATISYEYDRLNRLTSVTYGDGTRIAYAYDAAGNRLKRTISNTNSQPGDINGDGAAGLGDAILVLQSVSGMNPSGIRSDYPTSGADVNTDQKIGLEEALYILQKAAGVR
jgi:YD repeat-containing protein